MKSAQLWTWNDLSAFLQVGIPTLRKWVFQHRIPIIRFGDGRHALIRFDPAEIAEWLDLHRVGEKPSEPPNYKNTSRNLP